MEEALRRTYDATPQPRLVVALGDCACDGGIFDESYASCGRVSNVIPVDAVVPGCPPPPLEILRGEAWAPTVAARIIERIRARPDLRICLPTGDTPTPVYAELVAGERRGEVSLARATVILLDEWVGLQADDPARCDSRLRGELIDRLAAPPTFVPIDVDGPDDEAAALAHDSAARDLDLAVLGLGMNGHVGFNEPGSRPDDPTRLVRLAVSSRDAATARYGAATVPTAGITVGLARILEAGECWLLVSGERKAGILRRALEQPEGPDCPASYLRRHQRLTVFADEAAASLLHSG
jgi:glucosamine-6-phosphate deaminase